MMIVHRILLEGALLIHVTIAYVLPGQTNPSFSNANTTSPPYPNITPGVARPLGSTAAIDYSVYGTKIGSHIPNGTTVGMSISNGSTNIFANASPCFFVIQDTLSIRFWMDYSTSIDLRTFRVTSFINEITEYIDTVITNHATSITSTTSTLSTVIESSPDRLLKENYAPGPFIAAETLNETIITSWGRTFTSPEPFYIYSTVKILAVPAITSSNGQSACATAIATTHFLFDGKSSLPFWTETILPSANSKVYEYYNGDIPSSTVTSLPTHVLNQKPASFVGIDAAETKIVLATPYIYFPDLSKDYHFEDYGYIPQALIDLITQSPDITSSFPAHATFLPGGPSILTTRQFIDMPLRNRRWWIAKQPAAEDLTIYTAFTVTSDGCFHPDACRSHDMQGTTTTMPVTAHNLIQSPAVGAPMPTQAVKTAFLPGLKYDQSKTFALQPPAAASTGSETREFSPAITSKVADNSGAANKFSAESPLLIPVITIGSRIIPANSALEFELGSQTLVPGGDPIVFSSTTYSLALSATAIVVNGVSSALNPVRFQRLRTAIADGSDRLSYFADGPNIEIANNPIPYIVGGQTVVPGSAPIIVSGTTYSLDSSASTIFVNNIAKPLPKFQESRHGFAPVLSIGSQRLTANAASEYIVDGNTLSPAGSPIVVSGTTYSLDSSASTMYVNNIAKPLPKFQESHHGFAPVLSIGSQRLTANAVSEYVVDGKTLSPAGSPIVVSGTTYSLADQASALVFNGITSTLSAYQPTNLPSRQILSIGSLRLTADARLDYILDSQTLSPGGRPIVVSGTRYSLAPQASALVVNGVKIILPGYETLPTSSSNTPSSYQLDYIIGSQTLIPGAPAITISGIAVSLAASEDTIVIDGKAYPFPAKTAPSFTVGSQLLTATAVSRSIAVDEILRAAAVTASPALDRITGSNSSPSSATTSDGNGNEDSGSTFKSEASPGELDLVKQGLGVLLVTLGLALL